MRSKLLTTLILTRPRPHHPSASLCARSIILPNLPPPSLHPAPSPPSRTRTLTTTTPLLKKGGKQDSKRTLPPNASKNPPTSPFDLTDYDAAIARTHAHLKAELSKIKAGGLDPETIEGMKVQLVKGEKKKGGGGTTTRVGDIASVIVRGRNVAVLVAEREHVKPILSALLHSNLNPTTTSPTDPLTLLVPIPATTLESRREAKVVAGKRGEEALFALREARGAQRKRYRALELGKVVGPDELRRAEREVERVNGVAVGEAKRLVEGCRRALEGG